MARRKKTRYSKTGQKRIRGPNKIYSTQAARDLYQKFLRPFLAHFTMQPDADQFTDGAEAFFGTEGCRIAWCRAHTQFKMPGAMWADNSSPYRKVQGTGRRDVSIGDTLVMRVDRGRPDDSTVEFDGQVFSLTQAQVLFVNEKVKAKV